MRARGARATAAMAVNGGTALLLTALLTLQAQAATPAAEIQPSTSIEEHLLHEHQHSALEEAVHDDESPVGL